MPRLSALRLSALRDLAEQLRYAPVARVRTQLAHAVDLVPDIDPEQNYPEDWIIFRITGYRPELPNPSTIVGKALRSELSAFVERVSDTAGLSVDDLPEDSLDVEALGARWSVTRKTIERYRRRGLIAHRVKDTAGRTRLLFTPDAFGWFEAENAEKLGRAAQFTRIPSEEIERMLRVAYRARKRFGWSRGETARRVADRFKRAHETVRLLLIRTEERAAEPLFDEPDRLSLRKRLVIVAAANRGVPTGEIADRLQRAPTSIRRLLAETRAELLRSFSLPVGDEFAREWRPDSDVAMDTTRPALDASLEEFVDRARAQGAPDAALERALAEAHQGLLLAAGTIVNELPRYQPSPRSIDESETMLRWATLLRSRLADQQRRTALQAMESALEAPLASLPPKQARLAHATAMRAAADAAAEFDPSKGGRLAGMVVVFVNREIRALPYAQTARRAEAKRRASSMGVSLRDWRANIAGWQRWLDMPPHLVARLDMLEADQRAVVDLRFGLAGRPPMTTMQVGQTLDLHPLRIARLQQTAMRTMYAQGRRSAGAGGGAATIDTERQPRR